MNDVVGIRAASAEGRWIGFLTYGRIWDAVDDSHLKEAFRAALPTFGLSSAAKLEVCESLAALESCLDFYEGLLWFAWRPIPFGDGYNEWRDTIASDIPAGRAIFCVGEIVPSK